MVSDNRIDRVEYVKVSWDKTFSDLLEQIHDDFEYNFQSPSMPEDAYYKPSAPDFAFGRAGHPNLKEGTYHRLGNVRAKHKGSKIIHEGTMYMSELGAWEVINSDGLIVMSGSARYGWEGEQVIEKLVLDIKVKHERIERFEGIL
jgi:hypothetical protein